MQLNFRQLLTSTVVALIILITTAAIGYQAGHSNGEADGYREGSHDMTIVMTEALKQQSQAIRQAPARIRPSAPATGFDPASNNGCTMRQRGLISGYRTWKNANYDPVTRTAVFPGTATTIRFSGMGCQFTITVDNRSRPVKNIDDSRATNPIIDVQSPPGANIRKTLGFTCVTTANSTPRVELGRNGKPTRLALKCERVGAN